MTAIAGNGGAVKVGSNSVAELDNWSGTVETNMAVTTAFGASWKAQIPTIRDMTATASGRWYMGDTTGQLALQNALLGGTSVAMTFSVNGTNGYSGTFFLKNIQVKAVVDGTVDFTANFESTGAVTYA